MKQKLFLIKNVKLFVNIFLLSNALLRFKKYIFPKLITFIKKFIIQKLFLMKNGSLFVKDFLLSNALLMF